MRYSLLAVVFLLAGCMPGVASRTADAFALADAGGLAAQVTDTPLPLQSFVSVTSPGAPLWVFVEGDGLAWVTPTTPSRNPTPIQPVSLRLAASDPAANRLYLARPGQYLNADISPRYWLQARFATPVVTAIETATRDALGRADATAVVLVGYSGGAALTALLGQRLLASGVPVLAWYTVAGNLDPSYWTASLGLSPLSESLDPAAQAAALAGVPQVHLVGRDDQQVPAAVVRHFLARYPHQRCVQVVEVAAGHAGPWQSAFQAARAAPPQCQ